MNQNAALTLATRFHETYERLAPSFGYETRRDPDVCAPFSPQEIERMRAAIMAALALLSESADVPAV